MNGLDLDLAEAASQFVEPVDAAEAMRMLIARVRELESGLSLVSRELDLAEDAYQKDLKETGRIHRIAGKQMISALTPEAQTDQPNDRRLFSKGALV